MSERPYPGQWPGAEGEIDSPIMSATSGPMHPQDFYWPSNGTPTPPRDALHPSLQNTTDANSSMSGSPAGKQMRAANNEPNHALNSVKSTPVLLPSRPQGTVKNIANQFDQAGAAANGRQQPHLTLRTSQDRYRRPGVSKSPIQKAPRSPTKSRSPTKDHSKLQKKRPKSPMKLVKSPNTSFETSSSFGSTATIASTRSQPANVFSPMKQQQAQQQIPYMSSRPLFGEITADGQWNGNFDLPDYDHLLPYTSSSTQRRSSDGNIALGHGRSRSHQEVLQPASATTLSANHHQKLSHKRSRSDIDALQPPHFPYTVNQQMPGMYPTPPNSGTRNALHKDSSASRIPVSNRRQSGDAGWSSGGQSRSASAMSNPPPGRNRLSKSPTRKTQTQPRENAKLSSLPRGRYEPPPPPGTAPNGQTLSAKIVAPPPKTSPPLRSSRPRQPVSEATTSASRARAAERFQSPTQQRDGRRPSEQWLGKPYDPQQERSRRKIPELGKINFEERRARIQKAISQNLEESRSRESLRNSASRSASDNQAEGGAEGREEELAEQIRTEEIEEARKSVPGEWPTPGKLSVNTFRASSQPLHEPEPSSARTEFEDDESPILGRPSTNEGKPQEHPTLEPTLLTPATYQPPRAKAVPPAPIFTLPEAPAEEIQSPSVLDNVMQMRQRGSSPGSTPSTQYEGEAAPASGEETPSDLEDRWGLGNGLTSIQGSIKIMLDNMDNPSFSNQADMLLSEDRSARMQEDADANYVAHSQQQDYGDFGRDPYTESPVDTHYQFREQQQDPTRQDLGRDETIRASRFKPRATFTTSDQDPESEAAITRALEQYQSTGTITPAMLEQMQRHMVDLQRVSANQGSNGFMIQSLLDSVLDSQHEQDENGDQKQVEERSLQTPSHSYSYDVPPVTPDTPPDWEYTEHPGTAVVYSNEASYDASPEGEMDDEEDFYVKIRKADEAFERQQRGEYIRLGAEENEDKPAPPPKDYGYTPRSSFDPGSATFPKDLASGLRISTDGQSDMIETEGGDKDLVDEQEERGRDTAQKQAPPHPSHAPPPVPQSTSASGLPFGMPEPPSIPASYSERESSELSPRARRQFWGPSGSSRPSTDSQRPSGPSQLPASVSMSSLEASTPQTSVDASADSTTKLTKDTSPSPEQKRLLKRRHIIKELLDTENTYHQDLKIIEDIYRATAVPDLISPEDKKILFGNCDEIERFSLHFYDEMRKAVASVYIPAKQLRWMNKRGSYSTTQSDATGQQSMMTPDGVDDEKDRGTTIGQAFVQNLQQMEHVYSTYLKNHDAANQRLSALRNTSTVKCWLDECHNNANDITSAWDLDSLLVKPAQRVAKYPLLLQQLIETTPQDHPDREALSTAAKDAINMLTRINDAKKRADLVDQIVNRKRKDSDMRTGIAKAFGRRTEKIKERVGMAEAFQDPEFDELAHKFGGHFIRLQICMRDVQDYMNRIEKSIDQITNYAGALDLFNDVSNSSGSELESKWRKYGQAVRELTSIAFTDHKNGVNRRVIAPMVACIKLHEGPQNAINDRKKRIVDYAKCKAIEKRGEKPDKKTVEASDLYIALNDQLKLELPQLYSLTANLVQGCLNCFLDIQLGWYNTWERKLRPVLEAADIPNSIQVIEPAFRADYDLVKGRIDELGICNGAALAESANFLSPRTTFDESEPSSASNKRPSTLDSSKRTMSMGSDSSPFPGSAAHKRRSSGFNHSVDALNPAIDGRMRSNSALSARGTPAQTPGSAISASQQWSSVNTPTSSFSTSRPATANPPSSQKATYVPARTSVEQPRSPRPISGATYFTARPEQPEDHRFSNIFSSATPGEAPDLSQGVPQRPAPTDLPVLFVCASLFEFSIDKTRKEAGYPYLTYVQGEVFDIIAQKGELWLAKNQDDSKNTLGWIWEQHFVILSQD